MKKAIKKHLLFVAVLVTMVNYASNVSLLNKNIKKTVLTLNNVKEGQEILIKDASQIVLYRETIEKSGNYKRGFDLTTLPDGNYYFEHNKDIEIEVIPFSVKFNVVTFNNNNKTQIFKPYVKAKNNTVYISSLSLNRKPIGLSIYYENNGEMELIHNETIKNEVNIQKAYTLDASKTGNYMFSINTEDRTFSNAIQF